MLHQWTGADTDEELTYVDSLNGASDEPGDILHSKPRTGDESVSIKDEEIANMEREMRQLKEEANRLSSAGKR